MSIVLFERLRVLYPEDPTTPLRVLRASLAELTGLPPDRFKLIYSGAIMKDDNAPIASYRLKPGCTISLVGTNAPDVDASAPSGKSTSVGSIPSKPLHSGPPTQQSTLHTIESELNTVRTTLRPAVTSFLSSLNPPSTSSDPTPSSESPTVTAAALKQKHRYLSETLLQSLLRLDAILPESGWADVRAARKGAVKEVQGLLDQLDDGWREAQSTGGAGGASSSL